MMFSPLSHPVLDAREIFSSDPMSNRTGAFRRRRGVPPRTRRAAASARPAGQIAGRRRVSGKQLLAPSLYTHRIFATQECDHRKEGAARFAQRIVERLPIVAVL